MASRQRNKEGEKSKTNLVKREAKIDATLTQRLITSPLSQGWHHLDALGALRKASHGAAEGSLPTALGSWFLRRRPHVLTREFPCPQMTLKALGIFLNLEHDHFPNIILSR